MKHIYIASALLASSIISGCGGSEDEGRLFGSPAPNDNTSITNPGDNLDRPNDSAFCRSTEPLLVISVAPQSNQTVDRELTRLELTFNAPVVSSDLSSHITLLNKQLDELPLFDFVVSQNGQQVNFQTAERLGPNGIFRIEVASTLAADCSIENTKFAQTFASNFTTEEDLAPQINSIRSNRMFVAESAGIPIITRADEIFVAASDDESTVTYKPGAVSFMYPGDDVFENVVQQDITNEIFSESINDNPDIDGLLRVRVANELIVDSEGQTAEYTEGTGRVTDFILNKPSTIANINGFESNDSVFAEPIFKIQLDRPLVFENLDAAECDALENRISTGIRVINNDYANISVFFNNDGTQGCVTDVINVIVNALDPIPAEEFYTLIFDGEIVTDEFNAATFGGGFATEDRATLAAINFNVLSDDQVAPFITSITVDPVQAEMDREDSYRAGENSPIPSDISQSTSIEIGFSEAVRSVNDDNRVLQLNLSTVSPSQFDNANTTNVCIDNEPEVMLFGMAPVNGEESNLIEFKLSSGGQLEPGTRYQVCDIIGAVEDNAAVANRLTFDDLSYSSDATGSDEVITIDASFQTASSRPIIESFMPANNEVGVELDADVKVIITNFTGDASDCQNLTLNAPAFPALNAVFDAQVDTELTCRFNTKEEFGPPLLRPSTTYTINVPTDAFVNADTQTSGPAQNSIFTTKREVAFIIDDDTNRVSEIIDDEGNFDGVEVEIPTVTGPVIIPIQPDELTAICDDPTDQACFDQVVENIEEGGELFQDIVEETLNNLIGENDNFDNIQDLPNPGNGDESSNDEPSNDEPGISDITEPVTEAVREIIEVVDENIFSNPLNPNPDEGLGTIVDPVTEGVDGIVENIVDDVVIDPVVGIVEGVVGGISNLIDGDQSGNDDGIPPPLSAIEEEIPESGNGNQNGDENLIGVLPSPDEFEGGANLIGDGVGDVIEGIGDVANGALDVIGDSPEEIEPINPIIEPIDEITDAVGEGVDQATEGVSRTFKRVYRVISTPFGTIYKRIR